MKLETLLGNITPLPWLMNEYESVLNRKEQLRDKICVTGFALSCGSDTKEAEANNRYVHHAANVLPEVVEHLRTALRDAESGELSHERMASIRAELFDALAAAENVRDNRPSPFRVASVIGSGEEQE